MENTVTPPSIRPILHLLKLNFGLVPIIAGLDKFFNLLTNWEQYLSPTILELLPFSASVMMMVGVIEIIAGIIVLINTRIGGYIVTTWLTAIALSLLIEFNYLDVAVRDIALAIAAFSMTRLSKIAE